MGVLVSPVGCCGAARLPLLAVVRCWSSFAVGRWSRACRLAMSPPPCAAPRACLSPAVRFGCRPLLYSAPVAPLPVASVQPTPRLRSWSCPPPVCRLGSVGPRSASYSGRPSTCGLDSASPPSAVPVQFIPQLLSVACRSPGGPIGTVSLHLRLVQSVPHLRCRPRGRCPPPPSAATRRIIVVAECPSVCPCRRSLVGSLLCRRSMLLSVVAGPPPSRLSLRDVVLTLCRFVSLSFVSCLVRLSVPPVSLRLFARCCLGPAYCSRLRSWFVSFRSAGSFQLFIHLWFPCSSSSVCCQWRVGHAAVRSVW